MAIASLLLVLVPKLFAYLSITYKIWLLVFDTIILMILEMVYLSFMIVGQCI